MRPHEETPERMQVCLKFKAVYEDAERLIKRRVPEILHRVLRLASAQRALPAGTTAAG